MAIQYKTTDAVKIAKNPCNATLAKNYCNISKVWNPKLTQDENKLYLEFYIKWFYHRECELNSDDYQNCAMKLNQGEVKEVWNQMMSLINRVRNSRPFKKIIDVKSGFQSFISNPKKLNERLKELNPIIKEIL